MADAVSRFLSFYGYAVSGAGAGSEFLGFYGCAV